MSMLRVNIQSMKVTMLSYYYISGTFSDFSRALVRRVYKLLKQRDEKCWQSEGSWLQNEALSRGRLQENGTFKKALWNKLSSIVSPILSEVIAFVDRNQNLNLLVDHHSWRTTFWIAMLNNERVTSLSYDSFISPSNVIRERTRVFSTGDGHRFDGHFPFSWIIKDIVNVLLNAVQGW